MQTRLMARASSKPPDSTPAQRAFRRALSASVVAHAKFLAAQGEASTTVHLTQRRKAAWMAMEARKEALRASATTLPRGVHQK